MKRNKRYVAIDFETMDTMRSSVCSVAIVVIENNKIVDEYYSLIKPNTKYENPYCVKVHGLRYKECAKFPTFPEIWEIVDKKINGATLIAHNAPFEKSCINACHEEFGTENKYEYIDTLKLSRTYLTELNNHKLNTVCDKLGVKLEHHHNALDDAEACANIFIKLNKKFKLND